MLQPAIQVVIVNRICKDDSSVQDVVEALLQDKAYRESLAIAAPKRVSLAVRMLARVRAVAMLALLYLVSLPLTLATMMLALVLNGQLLRRAKDFSNQPDPRGTALVSGAFHLRNTSGVSITCLPF